MLREHEVRPHVAASMIAAKMELGSQPERRQGGPLIVIGFIIAEPFAFPSCNVCSRMHVPTDTEVLRQATGISSRL